MRKVTNWAVLTLALSVFAVNAVAQTPDGMTPAEETICDSLKADNVSKGLYGLCVAYCEAHDGPADVITTEEEMEKMGDPPSSILLALYQNKMREGDPNMPCVNHENTCPVWSQEELDRIGTLGGSILRDYEYSGYWENYYDYELGNGIHHYAQAYSYFHSDKLVGRYYSNSTGFDYAYRFMELTEAQYNACKQQLINHVTNPNP
jgi:hypothetical protein